MRCAPLLPPLLFLLVPQLLAADDAPVMLCNIERRAAGSLTPSEFREQFEAKRRPVVVVGAAQAAGWSAIGRWSVDHMVREYGDLLVHVGDAVAVPETDGFGSKSMRLREFAEACSSSGGGELGESSAKDTVFDRQEFVRQAGDTLAAETSPPLSYFAHWPQAGKGSTPYFSFGPKAVGLSFHEHSAAHNIVLFGRKHWFVYPPVSEPERLEPWAGDAGGEGAATGSPASWGSEEVFNMTFVELLTPAVWAATVKKRLSGEARPLECVTGPGDLIYVPAGWAHAVANLEASAALAWQLPKQSNSSPNHRSLDELIFRLTALGEHGRAAEATELIRDQLPWLRQTSAATESEQQDDGGNDSSVAETEDKDQQSEQQQGKEEEGKKGVGMEQTEDEIIEGLGGYVLAGEVQRDSARGECAAAMAAARRLLASHPFVPPPTGKVRKLRKRRSDPLSLFLVKQHHLSRQARDKCKQKPSIDQTRVCLGSVEH